MKNSNNSTISSKQSQILDKNNQNIINGENNPSYQIKGQNLSSNNNCNNYPSGNQILNSINNTENFTTNYQFPSLNSNSQQHYNQPYNITSGNHNYNDRENLSNFGINNFYYNNLEHQNNTSRNKENEENFQYTNASYLNTNYQSGNSSQIYYNPHHQNFSGAYGQIHNGQNYYNNQINSSYQFDPSGYYKIPLQNNSQRNKSMIFKENYIDELLCKNLNQ
jgi:hypothetical protein